MKYLTNFILNILSLPLYWLSIAVPKNKNTWVFGSWFGHRYSDSSRYIYEYIRENETGIRPVWLSREKEIVNDIRSTGGEAYLISSWKGFWISSHAGVTFVTCGNPDINKLSRSNSKEIQLWHGIPLKKIRLDDNITQQKKQSRSFEILRAVWMRIFPFDKEEWDIIIAAGKMDKERFATAFGVSSDRVKITGYPRGDVILKVPPDIVPAVEALKSKYSADKVICYAPTHRGEGKDNIDLFAGFNIAELENLLKKHNVIFVNKMHYYQQSSSAISGYDFTESRIQFLSEKEVPDLNLLLPHVNILLTDYSSVYFDYLLLDRPIIFTPFDMERYLTKDRELYEDYNSATPGPKCASWQEVIEQLANMLEGVDEYSDVRKEAQRKHLSFVDTNNCMRVVNEAKKLVNIQ